MSQTLSPTAANRLLEGIGGKLWARINHYDPERFNLSLNQSKVALPGTPAVLQLCGSQWNVLLTFLEVSDGMFKGELQFECLEGGITSASVSLDLEISAWSEDNYVLLPSAAYQGNRFPSRKIPYSPKLWFANDIGPDVPMIITDVSRLNDQPGPSRIQERSGSMAFPSIGFRSAHSGFGLWMMTSQGNELGDYGISIEENSRRDKVVLSITAPVVRELYSYRNCNMAFPSLDKPVDFKAGDIVVIPFEIHLFEAPSTQTLFDRYVELRKPESTNLRKRSLPFSACFALQEEKFNRENFVADHGYYSVGLRENFLQDWQIGWTGGMISTYPLLFAGGPETRNNVIRNFGWLFARGISPSGFFWDSGARGTEWYGGDIRKPHTANWHLIRKSADAVFYIVRQFMLMEKLGIEVITSWKNGTRLVCDAFEFLWRKNNQFGQFVDSISGEIRVGGSTSAALAPAALVLAAAYFNDERYLRVAAEAAELFYEKFTRNGLSCGGPGDALQNPDSESAYALIESYLALYEATGRLKWLERAGEAARQFSTWVVSYDFAFPPNSMFGRAGIQTTGSVYANTQNKHSAPGICTFSGLGLLKLFRATGDRFHLDLLLDIACGLPQYLPHPAQPLGDAMPGHMCERVNMTDWEGPERIGETLRMTTWAETSLMLTTVEIPGVYIRPDLGMIAVFDHVIAEIVADNERSVVVRFSNPTRFSASVRILSEAEAEAKLPLPHDVLCHADVLTLEPSGSEVREFPKSGFENRC